MAKKLGIQREHIYAWIKGASKIPLEYALQIEYLTGGEIHWKELVPYHITQRLKHLTLILPKVDLPPCELVYVAIERIREATLSTHTRDDHALLSINKMRPICIDSENTLIFGEETLYFYKQQHKRTIPAWRISLVDLAKGYYDAELFIKNFLISERVAVGISLEKFLGKRQGERSDLKNTKLESDKPFLEISIKDDHDNLLVQRPAKVVLKKGINLRQLIAKRLGFASHFSYQSAKKIKLNGSPQLIRCVDQQNLAISTAARLSKLSRAEQDNILTFSKKNIIKKAFEINISSRSNDLSITSKPTSCEENHALSNVRRQNLV